MRPLCYGDLTYAARALLAAPSQERADFCQRLLAEAELADRHRRQTGKPHPRFGNGSLMAAAGQYPMVPEPGFDCPIYRSCWGLVLESLSEQGSTKFWEDVLPGAGLSDHFSE